MIPPATEVNIPRAWGRALASVMAAIVMILGLQALPAKADDATVSASSAGTKDVGLETYAWGNVSGFPGDATVSTQVLIDGQWSTSQDTVTSGYYALPLTYGANTPGSYTWRVVASDGTTTAVSPTFTLDRTTRPTVSATSAGSKTVGVGSNVWGSVAGFGGDVTVSSQVLVNGQWSTSQRTTTSGYYALPLTYGASTPGSYTWRVVASSSSRTAVSPSFTFTRTASSGIPDSVWHALAKCESGNNPTIVSSNGLYYGLYQFSLSTWRSVGGSGLPTQASRDEQTNRARILQARSGWGQWPHCSAKLGLR